MSLDILGTLGVLGAIAASGNAVQAAEDISTLYKLVQNGKPDFAAMDKAGTLEPAAAALSRTSALLDKLLKDQTQRPNVVALLESIGGMV